MGCGSSTPSSSSLNVVPSSSDTLDAHQLLNSQRNASLVLGVATAMLNGESATASGRMRKLKERPKRGSQTFGEEQAAAAKQMELNSIKEQRKKDRELAAAAMAAAAEAAADGIEDEYLNGTYTRTNDGSDTDGDGSTPKHTPRPPPQGGGAVDETEEDSSSSSESSSDEDEEEDDEEEEESMEEIEEETTDLPIDDGANHLSPNLNSSTISARPYLQRNPSLHKIVKSFAPENCHILLVDDDAAHIDIVAQWLAMKRYHVTLCNDGEEAVEVLSATFTKSNQPPSREPQPPKEGAIDDEDHDEIGDFDLILSDLSMETPECTPLLDWVLRHDQTKHIPFILMSTDASSQSCDRAIRRGAEDFFVKPLQRNVILKTMRTILEQRIEQRNSAQLKKWGDKYKKLLLAEKRKDQNHLALAPSLSPYGSMDAVSTGPGASIGSPVPSATSTPTSNTPVKKVVDEDAATGAERLIRPNPELLRQPTRKALHIHVPIPSGADSPMLLAAPGPNLPPYLLASPSPMEEFTHIETNGEEEKAIVDQATVLLVDPSESMRDTLSKWLETINYTLIVQPSMSKALDYLKMHSTLHPKGTPRSSTFFDASPNPAHDRPHESNSAPPSASATTSTPTSVPTGRAPLRTKAHGIAAKATKVSSGSHSPSPPPPPPPPLPLHPNSNSVPNTFQPSPPSLCQRALSMRSTHTPSQVIDLIIADAEPFGSDSPRTSQPPPSTGGGGDVSHMTGSQFMTAIQAGHATKHLPVILLYHASTGKDAQESIRQGVETVLAKPVSRDMLLKKVNQVLTTIAQRKKSDMYAERAQAYRNILATFRAHRDEEVRTGKRSPMTLARRMAMGGGQSAHNDSPVTRQQRLVHRSQDNVQVTRDERTVGHVTFQDDLGLIHPRRVSSNTFTFDLSAMAPQQDEEAMAAALALPPPINLDALPVAKATTSTTTTAATASNLAPPVVLLGHGTMSSIALPPLSSGNSGRNSPALNQTQPLPPTTTQLPAIRTSTPSPTLNGVAVTSAGASGASSAQLHPSPSLSHINPSTHPPLHARQPSATNSGTITPTPPGTLTSPNGRTSPSVRIQLRKSLDQSPLMPAPAPPATQPDPNLMDSINSLTRKGSARIKFIIHKDGASTAPSPSPSTPIQAPM